MFLTEVQRGCFLSKKPFCLNESTDVCLLNERIGLGKFFFFCKKAILFYGQDATHETSLCFLCRLPLKDGGFCFGI